MSHDHDHSEEGHSHGIGSYRGADRKALLIAALLTGGFMVAEAVGGVITGSLALLADAGHMLSDSFSLFLALFAVSIAARPATAKRTFGYKRAEILAALVNGVLLVLVSLWVVYEAIGRLDDPVEVMGGGMMAIAVLGLIINVVAFLVLWKGGGESLNVRAALRHVLGDLLGSVGVIIAAGVILLTGWEPIDPIVSILISILIVASAWSVLKESVDVLLEAAPKGIDTQEVGMAMAGVAGVEQIHDLHIWQITSGFPSLSAHVLVGADLDCHRVRLELDSLLKEQFEIEHSTLQLEHAGDGKPLEITRPDGLTASS
ncbi:MAG TPA: cation diffusion facilitator family transporter [Solirubrobacterales bacterium]|nr:cation diffusion facilitator family transporter [Solirubrobacterales bacterium]HNC92716.1 cation diffusion facilitator family transporter [Solirubrobacterales bacterium]HNI40592.1 cation diffusion facilitator family transporter [Solirubrobacterales bacterium]HNL62818.1 cation diffusion facilitator family transporter [Solirubrobacterales bacterium]